MSWDNLYSRGPMSRRPDHLLVWSEEMRRQAEEVHQFPRDRIHVGVRCNSGHTPRRLPRRVARMRARVGLGNVEPFLAYVCGSRTSQYDVEDIWS